MPYFPLLKHINALGRPKRDVTFGVARLVGTRLRPPWVGRLKIVGRIVFVDQSVSQSVEAFSVIASERLDRSGPGYHRSTHRSAGTTMAPVPGRTAARGTWHVPPREGLQKDVDAPTGQTRRTADPKLTGHTYTAQTCVLLWLPFLCGAGCTRQRRKTFLTWGPPV